MHYEREPSVEAPNCVRTPDAFSKGRQCKPSLRAIWSNARKPKEPVAFLPYRLVATLLVWGAARLHLTPNMLSLLSVLTMALALAATALLPGPRAAIPFLALASLSFAIDCSDGPLARVTSTQTAFGHTLDATCDHFCYWLAMSAVVVHEIAFGAGQVTGRFYLALVAVALFLFRYDIGGNLQSLRRLIVGIRNDVNGEGHSSSFGGGNSRGVTAEVLHNVMLPCVFYLAVGAGWLLGFARYVYAVYVLLLSAAIGRHLLQLAILVRVNRT